MCSEDKKGTCIFVDTICFGKMVLFCDHTESRNTTKIGASAGTGENPTWHFWLQKCHLRGFCYLRYTKAVLCWKHYLYSVSAKHSCAEIKECKLKEKQIYPELRVVCQHAKRCFFVSFFGFWCFLLSLYFCSFLFGKAPERLFSCSFRGFSSFVPPKGLSLKSFSSSHSVFFLVFLLSSLSKFHSFLCLLSINPFLEYIHFVGFFCLSFLAFSFINVCLFLWNKLYWHPLYQNQLAFIFGCSFLLLPLFLFSCFMFLLFCFMFDLFFGMFCFSFVIVCFCFVSCFAFRLRKALFSLHF